MSEEAPVAKPQLDKKEEPQLELEDGKEAEEPATKKTKVHARGPPPLPQEVLEDPSERREALRRQAHAKLIAGLPRELFAELEKFGYRLPRPDDKEGEGQQPLHTAGKRGGSGQEEKALKEKALKQKAKQKS